MILVHLTVLALTALVAWWLSGYDTKVTGENKKEDRILFTCDFFGSHLISAAASSETPSGSRRMFRRGATANSAKPPSLRDPR